MPKPKDITDRKRQANKQNDQKPIGPRTRRAKTRAAANPATHNPVGRKTRQENPDSDEKYLILSKMDRTSLFRRFRLKRNAPDDGKQYEITKQTHLCSEQSQAVPSPRQRFPSRCFDTSPCCKPLPRFRRPWALGLVRGECAI